MENSTSNSSFFSNPIKLIHAARHKIKRQINLTMVQALAIILCQKKGEALVSYTLPEDNEQIFTSKYETILPRKEDFMSIISSEKNALN